ncbi:GNAT family N-acetyltransferase [Clostridium bowmanii]|uniref:GNAT family N-acetyltransferase n=1 Tax=Clostridium bowmanii TaxID=132925 RepID=UPI001C0DB778|nr:GNAT family protein [Clostridium bowmanii]MBU3191660.1 GNAT family N-acetyltransferase [Clostridium bowmanii]MCA1076010.1 GNAT family N-acetyltransferase [Clostridium bowmanii]
MRATNNAPTLENYNIILRQPIKRDIDIRIKLGQNMECVKMCGGNISKLGKFTMEDAIKWYERIIQHPCKWVIEYKGNCIGVVGLRPYKDDNKAKFSIEIYDNSVYSFGIGTKVTKMVLNYAFEALEYHKIYLRVLDYNARAIKCYEKCGFIKEGVDREGALINGTYCSDVYMGIIKPDYISLVK